MFSISFFTLILINQNPLHHVVFYGNRANQTLVNAQKFCSESGNTLLYREGELVIMSSTLLAPMEVEYVGHIDVSPEEEEKSRQEFLRILEKYFPASSLYGKSTCKQSKTPKLNADAEE